SEVDHADADATLALESAVAKVVIPQYQATSAPSIPVAELEKLSGLDWKPYFEGLGAPQITRVSLGNSEYFRVLGNALRKLDVAAMNGFLRSTFQRETLAWWDRRATYTSWSICISETDNRFGRELWTGVVGGWDAAAVDGAQSLWNAVRTTAGQQVANAAW